jgi:hypothetical protein
MDNEIELEPRSLAKWADHLDLPEGTLERWYYDLKQSAPATVEKIRCALYYGRNRCQNARGATKDNALQNLQKINLALEITSND